MQSKEELRKYIREQKKLYSNEEKHLLSQNILLRLEQNEYFREARTILLYHSLPDEVQTTEFIKKWHVSKQLVSPRVQGENLLLCTYQGEQAMDKGAFGIVEPTNEDFLSIDQIDVAIVPGMAFDKSGNRLGRGRGFYDRLLSTAKKGTPYLIGVAYPFQIVPEIPTEETDIRMDEVLY